MVVRLVSNNGTSQAAPVSRLYPAEALRAARGLWRDEVTALDRQNDRLSARNWPPDEVAPSGRPRSDTDEPICGARAPFLDSATRQ